MGEKEVIVRRGLVKKHAAVDYEVWQWKINMEQTRVAKRVTKAEVQAFAMETYKKNGINNFKASDGWYRRWRIRWQTPNVVKPKVEGVNKIENNVEPEPSNKNTISSIKGGLSKQKIKSVCKQLLTKKKKNSEEKLENCTNAKTGFPNIMKKHKQNRPTKSKKDSTFNPNITDKKNICSKFESMPENNDNFEFPNMLGLIRIQNINLDLPASDVQPISCNYINKKINENVTEPDSKMTTDYLVDPFTEIVSNLPRGSSSSDDRKNSDPLINTNVTEPFIINVCNAENEMEQVEIDQNILDTSVSKSSEVFEIEKTDKSNSVSLGENEDNDNNTDEHNPLWTLDSIYRMQVDIDSAPQKDIITSSQSDSGVSVSLTNSTFETSLSPLFDQTDLDFGDHEFFCDSCEDFHPRQKGLYAHCCKRLKNNMNNSLLSCVFEKKNLSVATISSISNKTVEQKSKMSDVVEGEEVRFKNTNIVMPKGKRYLVQFKSKVVNYALNHNTIQAAEKFKVNRGTVSHWLSERERLSGCSLPKPFKIEKGLSPDDSEFLMWLEDSKFNLTNDQIKQKTSEWLLKEGDKKSCSWLYMYAHRLNGTAGMSIKKRYIAYPESFKRAAVFHAQTHSSISAAHVFGVNRRRIVEWLKIAGDSKEKTKSDFANNVTDEAVDKKIFEWYCNQDTAPSSNQVRCKALELYRTAGHFNIQCGSQWYYRWRARHKLPPQRSVLYNDHRLLTWVLTKLDNNQCVTHSALAAQAAILGHCKCSRGWTFRFCRKHHKLLQSVPEPTTALPSVMNLQVTRFREDLKDIIDTNSFLLSNVVAMDELPLHFLPKDHSKKQILVRRSGFESCQATLMVSSLADGTLLPSMFIFKGMTPTCEGDPSVIAAVNETGLVTEEIMNHWLKLVCFNHLQTGGVLITDCYDPHTSVQVKQALLKQKVQQLIIPGGCAFKLHPIIKLCHKFKSMLEEMCQVSINNQTTALTSPTADELYSWSLRIHKHLLKNQKENIKTAFCEMLF